MESLEIRTDEFPIVIGTYPVHPTKEDVDKAFDTITEVARRGRFVIIADLSPMNHRFVTPELRATFYDRVNRFNADLGHNLIGEAVVIPSPILRLFHRAYLWMTPSRGRPCRLFANVAEARRWCDELLENRED